uniref:Uncharacterized protein n=1 Tax=Meloidogyne enterolobii TaxID=390850 RepID=A0A6V7UII0_MELEN|nr:unnamed protein product [Meloidogyne enterolobii]
MIDDNIRMALRICSLFEEKIDNPHFKYCIFTLLDISGTNWIFVQWDELGVFVLWDELGVFVLWDELGVFVQWDEL